MAQVNHTPIQLYHSTTAAAVPSPANMVTAELALNAADGKLYYKNAAGGVALLTDSTYVGTVTNVSVVSANGLAGTVANSTSTPAITLTTTVTGMVKGNGTALSAAVAGTDFAAPTSGTSILYGDGAGGFSNVTIGTGVSFVGGTLASTGTGGTVTSASVVTANGFAGTVANSTTTPAITLTTTITGVLKGNGTAISAAVSGTDYAPATSGTSILYGNGFGGFNNVTINPSLTFSGGTLSVSPVTSGTSILKGNGAGGFANATAGTDYAAPTSGTSILFGNGAGGFSNVTIGTGVSFAGGTLSATGTGGTVTSVTGTSPVASSGGTTPDISLAANYGDTQNPYASKTANFVLAAPNGSAGAPTFRAIVAADIPTLNQTTTGNAGGLATTNWTVFQSGTKLFFAYNGVNRVSIDSTGNIITTGNVTAFGTP
jgi:hypothetical protein